MKKFNYIDMINKEVRNTSYILTLQFYLFSGTAGTGIAVGAAGAAGSVCVIGVAGIKESVFILSTALLFLCSLYKSYLQV